MPSIPGNHARGELGTLMHVGIGRIGPVEPDDDAMYEKLGIPRRR